MQVKRVDYACFTLPKPHTSISQTACDSVGNGECVLMQMGNFDKGKNGRKVLKLIRIQLWYWASIWNGRSTSEYRRKEG